MLGPLSTDSRPAEGNGLWTLIRLETSSLIHLVHMSEVFVWGGQKDLVQGANCIALPRCKTQLLAYL